MKVSASVLVAAAIGVSAHPSGGHVRFHKARDYVVAVQPTTITTTTTAAYVAAAATSSAASSSSSSSSGSSSSSEYVEFCSSSSNSKRATTADIASVGNVGTSTDYGCNMMTVAKDIVDLYDYTVTFNNDVDEDQACVCWNKIGPDGGINGFFKGNEAINFTLPASGSAYVALQADSQGGCACTVGDTPSVSSYGQYAGTWVEFDFCSSKNSGWSGADASSLVALTYSLHVPALKVCSKSSDVCSTITTGSGGDNAYNSLDTVDADGIGLNLNTDTVHLTCAVGN